MNEQQYFDHSEDEYYDSVFVEKADEFKAALLEGKQIPFDKEAKLSEVHFYADELSLSDYFQELINKLFAGEITGEQLKEDISEKIAENLAERYIEKLKDDEFKEWF